MYNYTSKNNNNDDSQNTLVETNVIKPMQEAIEKVQVDAILDKVINKPEFTDEKHYMFYQNIKENDTEETKRNKEWSNLLLLYEKMPQQYSGCGTCGQYVIDVHYDKIMKFIEDNPAFKQYESRIKKLTVPNDMYF